MAHVVSASASLENSSSQERVVSDDELKQRWQQVKTVTKEALQIFDRISDRTWVVSECLRFEAHTIDEAKLLLQCALCHAVAYAVQDQLASEERSASLQLSEEELGLCALRFRVLHALDVLELHVALARVDNVAPQPAAAIALRDRSLTEEAVAAATAGKIDRAALLLAAGGSGGTLEKEGIWQTVNALPETSLGVQYEPLLRCALSGRLHLPLDWAEDSRLVLQSAALLPTHLTAHFAYRLSPPPVPLAIVEARLGARIRTIERKIGWAEGAAAVSKLAVSLWPQSAAFIALDRALRQLTMLVYESNASDMTLQRLEEEKEEAGRLLLLLDALPDEPLASIRTRMIAFFPFETARTFSACLAARLAPQKNSLDRLLPILTYECAAPTEMRILHPPSLLVRTSVSALYAAPDPPASHLSTLERLAAALAAQQSDPASDLEDEDKEAISALSGQVAVLKLLVPYGVLWRLADLTAAVQEPEKGAWLLEWLVRQGVARRTLRGTSEAELDRLWRELLADLRFLQHAPLGPAFATTEGVSIAALSGLLSAQRFSLAQDLMTRPQADLPPTRVRSLCLAAARTHIDGAASLADTEALTAASSCLELALAMPESSTDADLARERSFLSALHRLAAEESWRRALALWPPSRIRTADPIQIGSLLLAQPSAFRRISPLMDVLSHLGTSHARTLPLLLTAASSALEAGEYDICASLLAQLYDAQHAPATPLARKWLNSLMPAPITATLSRPYAAATPALGFLAAHDALLPPPGRLSTPALFLLSRAATATTPARPLGTLNTTAPPPPSPPPPFAALSVHYFYHARTDSATITWTQSLPPVRHAALFSPQASPLSYPDAPTLLASLLHRPAAEALSLINSLLTKAETLPASSSLPLLRALLTAACVHHVGFAQLRADSTEQIVALQNAAPELASHISALVSSARTHSPDPRTLLSASTSLPALQRLPVAERTDLLRTALAHSLATRPSDVPALLALSSQASVDSAQLVAKLTAPAQLSAEALTALRVARVATTWPSLAGTAGNESASALVQRTAPFVKGEQEAGTWLQLLGECKDTDALFWEGVLQPLLTSTEAPATAVRAALQQFARSTSVDEEANVLTKLRSAVSPLLLEAALGARDAATQEWALSRLLLAYPHTRLLWPGIALLPPHLLAHLRATDARLYGQLLGYAAAAASNALPRLCHPAEQLLCALLVHGWLADAAAVQALQTPSPAVEAQLLRIWRRVSLMACAHCKEERQTALKSLGQVLGL